MVEKIIINPNKVRGYGNIMNVHSSSDYDLEDCTIASGTDTVNGATMTVYTLTPTFSHSYSISFGSASYTQTGGSVSVSATLTEGGTAVSGATVTFTGGTSTVTATTNSSGVATATVSFSSSGTCTATYGSASDTASVTVQSYLFYDDASADHTSYYDTSNFSNATLSYSTDHYNMTMTSTNITSLFINDLTVSNNVKISVDMKITQNYNTQSGIIVMNNAKNKGIEALYQYGGGSNYSFGTTTSPTSHGSKIASDVSLGGNYLNQWVTLELTIQNGTNITYKLIDSNNTVILNYTNTITNQLDSTGNLVGLIHSYNNGMITQFKNLKVEAL